MVKLDRTFCGIIFFPLLLLLARYGRCVQPFALFPLSPFCWAITVLNLSKVFWKSYGGAFPHEFSHFHNALLIVARHLQESATSIFFFKLSHHDSLRVHARRAPLHSWQAFQLPFPLYSVNTWALCAPVLADKPAFICLTSFLIFLFKSQFFVRSVHRDICCLSHQKEICFYLWRPR